MDSIRAFALSFNNDPNSMEYEKKELFVCSLLEKIPNVQRAQLLDFENPAICLAYIVYCCDYHFTDAQIKMIENSLQVTKSYAIGQRVMFQSGTRILEGIITDIRNHEYEIFRINMIRAQMKLYLKIVLKKRITSMNIVLWLKILMEI